MRMIKKMSLGFIALGMVACNGGQNAGEENSNPVDSASAEAIEEVISTMSLVPLWQSDSTLITNESVFYYAEGDFLLVSNIEGKPTELDDKGSIAKVSTDGKIIDAAWATGISAPKGMCVLGEKLFVSDVNRVIAISMENTADRDYYPIEGAQFLNDLSTDGKAVYVSDMAMGTLHRIKDGVLSLVADSVASLNGLCYAENKLFGLSAEGLIEFDLQDGTYQVLNDKVQGGDGLVSLGDGKFIASKWQGEIWFIDGEEASQMLSSQEEGIQTADIGFNPNTNTVYVPRFFSNYISAFTLVSE